MPRGVLVAILTAGSLVGGCGVGVHLEKSGEAAGLRKLDEQWSAAAAKNDLEATLSFYADDAVVLPGNAPIAAGKKAIREVWAGMLGPGTAVSWKVTKVEVAKSGELGYLYGTYELTMQDPKGGPPEQDKGKLVEIWKKQPDGKWKCIVDTYNSDFPLPAAAAQK
jgi:uncharacterized protein (TIGR02246 family)